MKQAARTALWWTAAGLFMLGSSLFALVYIPWALYRDRAHWKWR